MTGRITILTHTPGYFFLNIHQYQLNNSDGAGDSPGVIERVKDGWLFTPLEGNRAYEGKRYPTIGDAFKAAREYRSNH